MCATILTAILVVLVVLIIVCVVCFGGLVASVVCSDLFIGIAAIVGALYLIKKYCKK